MHARAGTVDHSEFWPGDGPLARLHVVCLDRRIHGGVFHTLTWRHYHVT